jgi:hypothetical protein
MTRHFDLNNRVDPLGCCDGVRLRTLKAMFVSHIESMVRSRVVPAAWVVGMIVTLGFALLGCTNGASVTKRCGELPPDLCDASIAAAIRGLPRAVAARKLTAAAVQVADPADPSLCETWGQCDPVAAAWVVVLTYESEHWPVLVVRRHPSDPLEPAKPFE